ncbi:MAG: SRPBCC family protein [Myxococcaceae bacterium]
MRRKISGRAHPPALRLLVRRTIDAPAERLFRAWTEPDQLVKWWGPPPGRCSEAEVDLRVGGKYRIANAFPDGSVVWISGEFERISPPRELIFTWRLEGSRTTERVTVRFDQSGSSTEVVVIHERIGSAQARRGHEQGWQGCLDGLARFAAAA